LLTLAASEATLRRQASSDDCKYGHACPETAKDGRGCCPAPKVDAKKAAEAKRAADAKKAAEAKKAADAMQAAEAKKAAEAKEAAEAKQAEEAKRAADAKKSTDTQKVVTPTKVPGTASGCPSDMKRTARGRTSAYRARPNGNTRRVATMAGRIHGATRRRARNG
jgi:membrane protein involved in colicin uptake